jgi:zinc protease
VLVLGCHGPSELDKDSPALEVAVSILGQGLSSRLNKSVRERQKLVQSVSSGIFNGASPGLTYLWAELEPEQVTRAARAMWAEVEKMRASEVEVEELSRQRIRLEFSEAKERMSMEGLAGKLGYYETLGGDYRLADEQLKRMRAVTAADVRRVMKKYFRPENASLVVYRPASSTAIGLDAKGWTDLLKDGSEGEKQAAGSEEVKKEKRAKSVKGAVKAVKGSLEKCGGGFFRADLSNGLEVLIKPVRHTPLVCTHLVFKGGVRLEPAGLAGAFSLMSRLSLKGTKRKSAEQIAAEVDDLGAFVGPFSDSDTYGFSTQSLSSRFPQALALMAELILEPAYREDEFQKEKERTLKDIKDKKDSADEYLYDVFDELFFTHSPYSRPVEGTPETVKRIKPQDLDSLHERFLVPNNATLVLVGDLDPISALSLVEKNMGEAQWQKRALELPAVPREEAAQKSREKVEKLKKKQAHIMAGWLAPAPGDPDYFAFRLLNSVLGEGMNSRLFDEVRDKRGLCYTVYSFFDRGLDPGAMRVYVGTKPESEKQALEVVMQVVQGLRKNGVTREEMDSSKAYAKGVFEIARQDFGNEARIASQYEFWGLGVKLLDEFPGRIDAVTRADVQRVAQKYLDPAKATVAILRP